MPTWVLLSTWSTRPTLKRSRVSIGRNNQYSITIAISILVEVEMLTRIADVSLRIPFEYNFIVQLWIPNCSGYQCYEFLPG